MPQVGQLRTIVWCHMLKTTWKRALRPLATMFEETALAYRSLRLFVYDGTLDLWTAQNALCEIEGELVGSYGDDPEAEPFRYSLPMLRALLIASCVHISSADPKIRTEPGSSINCPRRLVSA